MASVKETHFFDDEQRDWTSAGYDALNQYFPGCDGRIRGEATPITFYWRPAIRRLHDYNPNVKFILTLRDPVVRAISNWKHEYLHGRETMPFAEAIRSGRQRVRDESSTEGLHRFRAYVERGLYGEQLDYLLRYFPEENIHCEIFEEFFRDQPAGLERLSRFLGIDLFPVDIPKMCLNRAPDLAFSPVVCSEDFTFLSKIFHHEIERVEEWLGRQVPDWHANR